ncbi:hypothetical protein KY290_028346 [Solanum tuberosum]|uniref:DDE-1 domain-containing protein n=1 Tax=Solanum tuberosum TaxID=4113 RepID=A0ABQ7UHN3_SOLTU|nr:hypothetical protein KY290_028346 [Solanum tuberosum]
MPSWEWCTNSANNVRGSIWVQRTDLFEVKYKAQKLEIFKNASLIVLVMDPLFSNHSPMSINVEEHRDAKKRPFKIFNCLAQHPEFKNKINASWQIKERGMQGVWQNLMKVRRELQQLNEREYMGYQKRFTN